MYQRKAMALLLIGLLFISLTACQMESTGDDTELTIPTENSSQKDYNNIIELPDTSEPSAVPAERLGFEGGNNTFGLICGGDDGYIYYRNEENWNLYKARLDGLDKTKLSDCMPDEINVLDGWVYFTNFSEGFPIYRIRTDGTDETKLIDGYCTGLYVAESGIYFNMRDEENTPHIYRADLDGGNMTLLYPDAWLLYYYKGMIYLGVTPLGVYNIETREEKKLTDTYVDNVSVDDSGIYYWAADENEFRRMDLDGTNDSVIVKDENGREYTYSNGNLYYTTISENQNGPCHVKIRFNIATNETTVLMEEANEFFDINGEWTGITLDQFYNHPETIDPELLIPNEQGEIDIGESENLGYVATYGEHLFMIAYTRDGFVEK